jgi:hypothetical protein
MPDFVMDQSSRAGVPIAYNFSYGGAAVDWGTKYLLEMGDSSCRSEPIDGKFAVSELRTTFSDTNGSIWGSLGHGTTCFGSTWEATCYVGGSMGITNYGPGGTRLSRSNLGSSGTFLVFSGRITDVRRVNRSVEISAKNVMAQVEDLEWEFPVENGLGLSEPFYFNRYGSNFFWAVGNLATQYGTYLDPAFFNQNSERDQWELYGWLGSARVLAAHYPTPAGRGTMGAETPAGFLYRGGTFRQDYERVYFQGTYLGTYVGTINSDEEGKAQSFGYPSAAAAEAAKVSGSLYKIGTTRVICPGHSGDFQFGSRIYLEQAGITLGSTPAYLWYEMLTGCCVTPLFATTSIDADTFATAARNVTFRFNEQRIDPKGGKVLPHIKDLLAPLMAQWAVGVNNKFKLFTYGAKILSDVIGTITATQIISSEVSSSESDVINRVTLNYGYNFETGSFAKRLEKKGSNWGSFNDHPRILESKWLENTNEAIITVDKVLQRNQYGVPRLKLKLPLTYLSGDIGSLYQVVDTNCLTGSKTYEVSAWRHDFSSDRTVDFSMLDAANFYQRGYARWEGDSNLTAVVSGTSLSGWGTGGTVNNINRSNFGSQFYWF